MNKKILTNLKCNICNSQLVQGGLIYQNYENVINYIDWPNDLKLNKNDLIRICSGCAKKYSLTSIKK